MITMYFIFFRMAAIPSSLDNSDHFLQALEHFLISVLFLEMSKERPVLTLSHTFLPEMYSQNSHLKHSSKSILGHVLRVTPKIWRDLFISSDRSIKPFRTGPRETKLKNSNRKKKATETNKLSSI